MRRRLVRSVVTVALAELVLVMHQFPLLLWRQHTKLPVGVALLLESGLGVRGDFFLRALRQVVVVGKARQVALFTQFPTQAMVVRDVAHVVGVDGAEGSEAITHYTEEADEDAVDDVDDVVFPVAGQGEPADQAEDPDQAESSDEEGVEGDEEAES